MPRVRYFLIMASSCLVSFTVVWIWVAMMPMAFLDPEYPYWRAKQMLLERCDLGQIVILGDSRAASGIIPSVARMTVTNLAVGGGKPVEALAAVRRMLACPQRPERVIISFGPTHFMRPDLFWERSVRFGFLDLHDLREVAAMSQLTGDWSVYEARQTDGLPPRWRAWLHGARFPGLYFSSVLKGGVFLRWFQNNEALRTGVAARGHYHFGTDPGSHGVAAEGHLPAFMPAKVLDHAFDLLLSRLSAAGIAMEFVAMPVNQSTWDHVPPAVRDGFDTYLRAYASKYPAFTIAGPTMLPWPDRWFGDAFSHLNPEGAARYSRWFARCLAERRANADGAACAMEDSDPRTVHVLRKDSGP